MTRGQRIKSMREMRQISQTDLAKRVGISKQTLYKYEQDIVTNIPSDIIEKLADYLDCSPAYIMGWQEQSTESRLLAYASKLAQLNEKEQSHVMEYIDFVIKKGEKQ